MNQIQAYQVTTIMVPIMPMIQSPFSIPHTFLEGHLPEVINEALLSTGFSSAQFTAQEGKAKQGAQLH